MKILHTSDLHLGISLCGKSLLKYQEIMIKNLCSTAKSCHADAVILAGDIYDRAVAGAEAIALYDRLITELCVNQSLPVILCAGNHDGAERLSAGNKLLSKAGLYISGRLKVPIEPVKIGNCSIYSLPYFNQEELCAALGLESGVALAEAVKILMDSISLDKSVVNVLAAHCFITGGQVSDSDTSAQIGGADALPASLFQKFDYVALGHLHRAQEVAPGVRYSGTPMPYSFGEAGWEKSVAVFDTDTKTVETIPLPQPVKMREITGEFETILSEAKASPSEDFIKIVLTDRFSGQGLREELTEFYPNLLHFSGKSDQLCGNFSAEILEDKSPLELAALYYESITGEKMPEAFSKRFLLAAKEAEKEELQ